MGKSLMEQKILNEVEMFCDHYIVPFLNTPVELSLSWCKAVNNIISEMMFGGRHDYDDPDLQKLLDAVTAAVRSMMRASVTHNLPIVGCFFSAVSEYESSIMYLRDTMDAEVTRHKQTFDPGHPRDIFDSFLAYQKKLDNPSHEDSRFFTGTSQL